MTKSTCDNCGYTSEWIMEMQSTGEILCDKCLERLVKPKPLKGKTIKCPSTKCENDEVFLKDDVASAVKWYQEEVCKIFEGSNELRRLNEVLNLIDKAFPDVDENSKGEL